MAWSLGGGSVDLNTRLTNPAPDLYLRVGREINEAGMILTFAGSWDEECQCSVGSDTVLLVPQR